MYKYPSIINGMPRTKINNLERKQGAGLGLALQTERTAKRKTQDQVASKSGVPVDTLRRIEQGHVANPGVFTVAAIAAALDRSLNYFVKSRKRTSR